MSYNEKKECHLVHRIFTVAVSAFVDREFIANIRQLHLELKYSRIAVPFNSTYSQEPTFIYKCQFISIVSEFKHDTCYMISYRSNSQSCLVQLG